MLQKLDVAKETFSAILMITSPDSTEKEVCAFEKELRKIADIETGEVGDEDLLEATPFSCCTN
jgi:hypothetical protein